MSTYHEIGDVEAKFKKIVFGTDSPVTDDEVEEIITKTEAYVVGKISPFYDVSLFSEEDTPLTWAIVGEICALYSAGKVNEILRKNAIENVETNDKTRADNLIYRAEKMLKGIALFATVGNVDGALSLPDATPIALSTSQPATGQGDFEPQFKREIDQW